MLVSFLTVLFVVYTATVLAPRSFWVVFGRPCPHCSAGRLTFQGLLGHPWRTLRSWWRCQACQATLHESRWGRLQLADES